ncbi:hypothetical protein PHSC3_001200 [Chlamydiales bacterium STE3]|nr:hypothetical protein PHSC3_001200 [Chlamydiales bacterium STE3]
MKMLLFILANTCVLPLSAEGVCQKCERIREYNEQNPGGEFEFYEDYLQSQEMKKKMPAKNELKI